MTTRKRAIVETFNTHRMKPEVVEALATARTRELSEIMQAIEAAATEPGRVPQHLIVYGERGAGKSFLMRMAELEVHRRAAVSPATPTAGNLKVAFALLPEEQRNIHSVARLIETVAAHVRGEAWEAAPFIVDAREPEAAWEEAKATLAAALDARFGKGEGLVVAAVENFDALSLQLFGADPKDRSKGGVMRRAAEEKLRNLMSSPGARFMLLAGAVGTVDMDYDRPLFMIFKPIDLSIWSDSDAIDYYNRRRALDGLAPLTPEEVARARAITAFIGGNPRLAQLLGEVLSEPDAQSIAEIFDALVDHLAEYYKRRLDDLPPMAAGLLDALIRGGEPKTQSELAAALGLSQNQIADAFSVLTRARLLAAEAERGGKAQLYRVRDRLFVHYYRRRNAMGEAADGLARIAELLRSFYSEDEKAALMQRHLDAGEIDKAGFFAGLMESLPEQVLQMQQEKLGVELQSLIRETKNKNFDNHMARCSVLLNEQKYEEALTEVNAAVALIRESGDADRFVHALILQGLLLGILGRKAEAVAVLDEAVALADKSGDRIAISLARNLKDSFSGGAESLRADLTLTREALALNLSGAEENFARLATRIEAPDVVTVLTNAAARLGPDWRVPDSQGHYWIVAVARARRWKELLALLAERPALFQGGQGWRPFLGVGLLWAWWAKEDGRAATYARIAADLPLIVDAMSLLPDRKTGRALKVRWLEQSRDLALTFAQNCTDPGLLRDVADLLARYFQENGEEQAIRLRAFAGYYAAQDKPAHLQRLDPDLARVIRILLELPEPEDTVARKGRRRAR